MIQLLIRIEPERIDMTIGALDQEYKEIYNSEICRRDVLNQAIDRPVAIITAFGGILYFCVSNLQHPLSLFALFQLLLAGLALVAILAAVYFIVRSYWNHTYAYVPTPFELSAYRAKLEKYYCDYGLTPTKDLDSMVLAYIYESYVIGSHKNAENNRIRSAYLHRGKTFLIIALPLVILLGLTKIVTVLSFAQLYCDVVAVFA